jgi:hypothetical protein
MPKALKPVLVPGTNRVDFKHGDKVVFSVNGEDPLIRTAMDMAVPPSIHMAALKAALPELRDKLRAAFVGITGENPWGEA